MNRLFMNIQVVLLIVFSCQIVNAQNLLTHIDFSGDSAGANNVTLMGAGFGGYPMPDVSFGDIPADIAFEGATDGRGMIVTATPGQGVMILTPTLLTPNCALLRCSVRLSAPHASLCLASSDIGDREYVSTITPSNPSEFVDRYGRIADFFLPPSTGFRGIVQIINTSETETLKAYIDNFEVLESGPDKIEFSMEDITGEWIQPVPTPTITPVPIAEPIPNDSGFSGETFSVPLDLPDGAKELVMVKIPGGTFMMGSPSTERGRNRREWLRHQVTLTKDFFIGRYEVTLAQYQAVINIKPTYFSNQPNQPVDNVSWYDAVIFCNALSKQSGLTPVYNESDWTASWTANGYRLPTEAEWERACRANTTTRFSFGNVLTMADTGEEYSEIGDRYMWWVGNRPSNFNQYGPNEVGLKIPNPWSLYDMHGNVSEWCHDRWDRGSAWMNNNNGDPRMDPLGPESDRHRTHKGGSWDSNAAGCRSAYSSYATPGWGGDGHHGFRLAIFRRP